MNIAFPELENPIIKQAVTEYSSKHPDFSAVPASSLEEACKLAKSGTADALIAGIDYTTRDVVLACKDYLGALGSTFSSCFVMKRLNSSSTDQNTNQANLPDTLILADAGVTKNPTIEQLTDIVLQTYETATKILDEPRIAMLSFSTFGSAKDESIDKINTVIERVHEARPGILIDGEMQLDCAINPRVAEKKAANHPSKVAGYANVLITPDLNSGNILYKSLEQFGGYIAAGPILQGFSKPASDLSRGSTVEDIKLVIETIKKLV